MAGRPARKYDQPRITRNKALVLGRRPDGAFVHSLTPEIHERIVKHVATGASVETAAAAVGVTLSTLRKWLIRGQDALMADTVPETEQIFADLSHDVNGVLARWEISELERIARHGDYDWRASGWLLEHRLPGQYGRRSTVEIGNKDGEAFRVDSSGLDAIPLKHLEELKAKLAEIRGALPAGDEEPVTVDAEFEEVSADAA